MERWLAAHRIGLAAYWVHVLPPVPPTLKDFESARRLLSQYLLQGPEQGVESLRPLLMGLPSSVLALLAKVTENKKKVGNQIHAVFPQIDRTLHELSPADGSSLLGRAQILAYHVLLGRNSPKHLVRLGRTLFGQRWRQIEKSTELVDSIGLHLNKLRDPWAATRDRCTAIGEMAVVFHETPYWAQIENILYQNQFCWPLLVLDEETGPKILSEIPRTTTALAMSLPVAVDLSFDGRNIVSLNGMDGIVLVEKWKGHLRRAVRVAKDLWRAKHGNHGSFRHEVELASVTFDFRFAQAIAGDLGESGFGRIPLADGSADAYFAQVVLSRLLGRSSVLASAATGLIGEQLRHEDGMLALNYRFVCPGGIEDKLVHVFACKNFERMVVPEEAEPLIRDFFTQGEPEDTVERSPADHREGVDIAETQTAEILFAHDLQTLADIMQVNGWRQYQYVRCPEVAWAVHSAQQGRPGLLDAKDERVQNVIRTLAWNSSTIALCDASPVVVASALWHINTDMRKALKPYPPPSLSWAFIRPLDDEQDTRFWQLLWKAVGASADDFQAFIQHPSRDEAISRLADALNRFEPNLDCPSHRAPDVIVLVGTQRFEDNKKEVLNPLSRPFMVAPILEALSSRGCLQGPHDDRLLPLVGKIRIILLPTDDPVVSEEELSLERFHLEELNLLRKLATFECGFTQQMASLILSESDEYSGAAVRDKVLEPFVRKGVLRYGQGRYHIPWELMKKLRVEEEPGRLVKKHYSAGCALAPYAAGTEFPALALDAAFSPEYIHDAERHFFFAVRYGRLTGNHQLFNASRRAFQHLTRFAEVPGWGRVDMFLKAGDLSRDAYEMATELLEWQHASNVKHHPAHLLLAARAAAQWAKQNSADSTNTELGRELRRAANSYFNQALKNCSAFPSEEEFNRLSVLTSYSIYLSEHEPQREGDLNRLSEQALDLLAKGANPRAVPGQWFELLADRESVHATAAPLYGLGIKAVPEWAQLWIKGFGTASLAGLSAQMHDIRNALSADRTVNLLSKSTGAYQRQRRKPVKHISLRWEEGLRLITEFWGSDRSVRSALEKLRRMGQ